ncbi:hypothetical protein GH714_006069 [Hevea brasiliensis]|uniref:RFTS domain-containing protein n=1 Tax=Hevea brasiliensis TaxID=3981 RepID=A0A6A6L1C7_HEVBR|nr:hypothetical protein GH714_006069 [Hevea brasiliensis]
MLERPPWLGATLTTVVIGSSSFGFPYVKQSHFLDSKNTLLELDWNAKSLCFGLRPFCCLGIAKNTRGGSKSSTSGVEESNHRSGVATKLKQKRSRSENEIKREVVVEHESVALGLTAGQDDPRSNRRLKDFTFHDAGGNPQPLEMLEIDNFFISGLILPLEESIDKEKGVRCNGFGRIESWVISGYEEGSPVIWVSTGLAYYDCIKPSYKYRRFYNLFFEKAHACVEVYRKLSRTYGGNSNIGVDELIAGVARAMSTSKNFPQGMSIKDFIISSRNLGIVGNTSLKVVEESADQSTSTTCGTEEDEDMKLARLLQEENWLSMKQNNRQSSVPPSKFYIKINENEIANDYPLHTYYKTSVEEIDEFLAICNDGSNELPENMLHNWTLYNSDA